MKMMSFRFHSISHYYNKYLCTWKVHSFKITKIKSVYRKLAYSDNITMVNIFMICLAGDIGHKL